MEFRGNIFKISKTYLTERTQRVEINEIIINESEITFGVLRKCLNTVWQVITYADDTVILENEFKIIAKSLNIPKVKMTYYAFIQFFSFSSNLLFQGSFLFDIRKLFYYRILMNIKMNKNTGTEDNKNKFQEYYTIM